LLLPRVAACWSLRLRVILLIIILHDAAFWIQCRALMSIVGAARVGDISALTIAIQGLNIRVSTCAHS